MKRIGITSRVDLIRDYNERRDSLDQRWFDFIIACGFLPVFIPNSIACAKHYLTSLNLDGFILSGGNSHEDYGGNAPERDAIDQLIIEYACSTNKPLIGVCRGMQSVQIHFGGELVPVEGQVTKQQEILINRSPAQVNSYHNWAAISSPDELEVWAQTKEGIIKAIKHRSKPITGVMWHPERYSEFNPKDIELFQGAFL